MSPVKRYDTDRNTHLAALLLHTPVPGTLPRRSVYGRAADLARE